MNVFYVLKVFLCPVQCFFSWSISRLFSEIEMNSSKYKPVSESIRELIIQRYNDGNRVSQLATVFDVNINTIYSIIKRYKAFGNAPRPRGKKKRKLNQDQIDQIRAFNELGNACNDQQQERITLTSVQNFISTQFDVNVSVPTISRYLN